MGIASTMMTMARNAKEENPERCEVHVALPKEKRAVAKLEAAGLVTVRRTNKRCGGHLEWWYRLA